MIPIPHNGIYQSVKGLAEAAAIADVVITAKQGQRLQRLPEGNSYLGFLFSRASNPQEVEQILRLSHGQLNFEIAHQMEVIR